VDRRCAWFLGAVGLLPLAFAFARADAGDAERVEPVRATLGDLRADPAAFVGREVRFELQLERRLATWQPFLTRFGPGDFAGFRAWADDAFLWERAAFEDPSERLFARLGAAPALVLAAGTQYERFEVTAIVRDVFLGEPWIEVLQARRLPEHVGEGGILHAARGLELLAQGNRDLARDQLQRARAGFLPAHAAAELDRLIAACDG
jgi:hypothetical protein